jgi:hypothetical protein
MIKTSSLISQEEFQGARRRQLMKSTRKCSKFLTLIRLHRNGSSLLDFTQFHSTRRFSLGFISSVSIWSFRRLFFEPRFLSFYTGSSNTNQGYATLHLSNLKRLKGGDQRTTPPWGGPFSMQQSKKKKLTRRLKSIGPNVYVDPELAAPPKCH